MTKYIKVDGQAVEVYELEDEVEAEKFGKIFDEVAWTKRTDREA